MRWDNKTRWDKTRQDETRQDKMRQTKEGLVCLLFTASFLPSVKKKEESKDYRRDKTKWDEIRRVGDKTNDETKQKGNKGL